MMSNILKVLSILGNPHLDLQNIFYIVGTTGKTSIGRYIVSILQASGNKVNAIFNGNLESDNHRIVVNGKIIDDNSMSILADKIQSIAKKNSIALNGDEMRSLMGILAISQNPSATNVIETGAGHKNDYLNILQENPYMTAIMGPIDVDHAFVNGNTPELNMVSHMNLLSTNSHLISSPQSPNILKILLNITKQHNITFQMCNRNFKIEQSSKTNEVNFFIDGECLSFSLNRRYMPYQLENIGTAIAALYVNSDKYDITSGAVSMGINSAKVNGQMQQIQFDDADGGFKNSKVYYDAFSNGIGATTMLKELDRKFVNGVPHKSLYVILSLDNLHQTYNMMRPLKDGIKKCFVFYNRRTLYPTPIQETKDAIGSLGIDLWEVNSFFDAMNIIAYENNMANIVIAGCANIVNDIRDFIGE
ncbi:hypothetical protein N9A04_00475 [Rickettsiales bacterium]|nr:hypothetical protein [Rickettsiales bacterium]